MGAKKRFHKAQFEGFLGSKSFLSANETSLSFSSFVVPFPRHAGLFFIGMH
jgi:hypothetical protein